MACQIGLVSLAERSPKPNNHRKFIMKLLPTLAVLATTAPFTLATGPPDESLFTSLFNVTLEIGPPLKPIPVAFGVLQIGPLRSPSNSHHSW